MANTLLTLSVITREAMMVLSNQLAFSKTVNRQFEDEFGAKGAKAGNSIKVRKPPRYKGRSGEAISVEDATEEYSTLTLSPLAGVDISFTTTDLTLSIDDFSNRFLKPAMSRVAQIVDVEGMSTATKSVWNSVGTVGTVPSGVQTYLDAGALLDENCAPEEDRSVIVSPKMNAKLVGGLTTILSPSKEIGDQYRKGSMGSALGFDFYRSANVYTHTFGAHAGTGVVDGASQTGASINTKSWTASTTGNLKAGDIITFANVYAVNPANYQSTNGLQQFVLTADSDSDSSGDAALSLAPSIVTSGSGQTVTASPADAAAITLVGSASAVSQQGLAYHKDAFTLACVEQEIVGGVDMCQRVSDSETGLSLRLTRQYDISTNKLPCRVEMLYGWAALRSALAVRIQS